MKNLVMGVIFCTNFAVLSMDNKKSEAQRLIERLQKAQSNQHATLYFTQLKRVDSKENVSTFDNISSLTSQDFDQIRSGNYCFLPNASQVRLKNNVSFPLSVLVVGARSIGVVADPVDGSVNK